MAYSTSATSPAVLTGLTDGTAYYVQLVLRDAQGSETWTPEVSVIPGGLAGEYRFVDGSLADTSGSATASAAVLSGGVTKGPDRFGSTDQAYLFDGTSGYLNAGHAGLDLSGAATFSAWVRLTGWNTGSGGISAITGKPGNTTDLDLDIRTDKSVYLWTGASHSIKSTTAVALGQWYHLVVRYKSSATQDLWINGTRDVWAAIPATRRENTNPVWIGANPAWTGRFFQGNIGDVRFYNRCLTDDEVGALAREYDRR